MVTPVKGQVLDRLKNIQDVAKVLSTARQNIEPKLQEALTNYCERVEQSAVQKLNRPSWLMSCSFGLKVRIVFKKTKTLGNCRGCQTNKRVK